MAQTTLKERQMNITTGGESTEKVLNTQSKCKVYKTADQSNIADDTATKVVFEAEVYDIGNDFDLANDRFVAPVSGYYLILGHVYWKGLADNKRYSAMIYVNGGNVASGTSMAHSGITRVSAHVSAIAYVESGQYIELYCHQISGVSTPDVESGSENETSLTIHLLSV